MGLQPYRRLLLVPHTHKYVYPPQPSLCSVVRHTFNKYYTYVGWGLDSVWPALLHFPKDRVAVIDRVCMVSRAPCCVHACVRGVHFGLAGGWRACTRYEEAHLHWLQAHPPSPVLGAALNKSDSVYRPGLSPYSPKQEEHITFAGECVV
jgi:hypothetical protein